MLISVPKLTLGYFAICLAIATAAVTVMTDANRAPVGLANNAANGAIAPILEPDQVAADRVDMPDKPQAQTPMQQAAAAFQAGEQAHGAAQYAEALTHYETALGLSQAEGNRQYEAMIWQRVAKTYAAAQDYQRAETYYQTAIKIGTETQATLVLGEAQTELAQLYEQQGDRARALPLYRQALAHLRTVGDQQTAQLVSQQSQKIAISLEPKPKAKVKAAAAKPSKKILAKSAPKVPSAKVVSPTPAIKVAIEPETIVQPPESIERVRDDLTQDPEPPVLDAAM
jgi:tetratricopeptide (TPR) repeat protein